MRTLCVSVQHIACRCKSRVENPFWNEGLDGGPVQLHNRLPSSSDFGCCNRTREVPSLAGVIYHLLLRCRKITACMEPHESQPHYRVTPKFRTRGLRRIKVTSDSNYGREMKKKKENTRTTCIRLLHSFEDASSVVVEGGGSLLSGPASAPSGTPSELVAVSPTW